MVPDLDQIHRLWDAYNLPPQKRQHVTKVAAVAMAFAQKIPVNKQVLLAAALLHDIDKSVGGAHPETAVAILKKEGMSEVADVVGTHSLHMILDPKLAPKTWEQKLLFLADKMVKYDIVGVDRRFALWNAEHLRGEAQKILDESYPKVKKLEQEVFELARISFDDILALKEVNL